MRGWEDYDDQYNEPRVALHCVVCGELDRAYLVDSAKDGEDGHQCLRCARNEAERRRLMRAAVLQQEARDVA